MLLSLTFNHSRCVCVCACVIVCISCGSIFCTFISQLSHLNSSAWISIISVLCNEHHEFSFKIKYDLAYFFTFDLSIVSLIAACILSCQQIFLMFVCFFFGCGFFSIGVQPNCHCSLQFFYSRKTIYSHPPHIEQINTRIQTKYKFEQFGAFDIVDIARCVLVMIFLLLEFRLNAWIYFWNSPGNH